MTLKDFYSEFNALPIAKSINSKMRQQIMLLQVIPDDIRSYNVLLITESNDVYAFGDNTKGCLGLGHCEPVSEQPQLVRHLQGKNIVQIATGHLFVVAISRFGQLWSWGVNTSGQLAQVIIYSNMFVCIPTEIERPEYIPKSALIVKVACGHSFGIALSVQGDVYTFGDNSHGQLGLDGSDNDTETMNEIEDIDKIGDISCGANHLVLLSANHSKVYVCGSNQFGQLGLKTNNAEVDKPTLLYLPFKHGESVKSISCGLAHTLVLLSTGTIYAFGDNRQGQLGFPTSNGTSTCVPQLIQVDQLFDQLFTINLSNISVAKSSSRKNRLFVWGAIKKRDVHREQVGQSKQGRCMMMTNDCNQNRSSEPSCNDNQEQSFDNFALPRRSFVSSVYKLLALYEPNCLTFSEKLTFGSSVRKGRSKDTIKLFNQKDLSDVHFVLNGDCLYGHKTVLVSNSDYFHQYFDFSPASNCPSSVTTITICDFSYRVFRAYLHFIYTGSIFERALKDKPTTVESIKFLVQLTELAIIYEETDLFELCFNHLISPELMQPQTVMLIYDEAYQCQTVPLFEECLNFITANWSEMLKQPDFERWQSSTGPELNIKESR